METSGLLLVSVFYKCKERLYLACKDTTFFQISHSLQEETYGN